MACRTCQWRLGDSNYGGGFGGKRNHNNVWLQAGMYAITSVDCGSMHFWLRRHG